LDHMEGLGGSQPIYRRGKPKLWGKGGEPKQKLPKKKEGEVRKTPGVRRRGLRFQSVLPFKEEVITEGTRTTPARSPRVEEGGCRPDVTTSRGLVEGTQCYVKRSTLERRTVCVQGPRLSPNGPCQSRPISKGTYLTKKKNRTGNERGRKAGGCTPGRGA